MKNLKINIEEQLNSQYAKQVRLAEENECIHYLKKVNVELEELSKGNNVSLYDEICNYIRRINENKKRDKDGNKNAPFEKKSGKLDEKEFYKYAYIDKNTWSNIRLNAKGISKESALKLVIALQLEEDEAKRLLKKASWSFDVSEQRDRVILALLHIHCFHPEEAAELLDVYSKDKNNPFINIYDMEKIRKNRKNFPQCRNT